jgi:ribonuclease Z
VGLINTFGLLSHQQDLHVFGPSPLQEIIELQLKVAETNLPFKLHFHTITKEAVLVDDAKIKISCFRTNHRIECYGFVFEEKRKPRKLEPAKAIEYEVPSSFYERLRDGEDYYHKDGTIVKNEWVTTKATERR